MQCRQQWMGSESQVRAPRQRSEIERDKLAEDQNAGGH